MPSEKSFYLAEKNRFQTNSVCFFFHFFSALIAYEYGKTINKTIDSTTSNYTVSKRVGIETFVEPF